MGEAVYPDHGTGTAGLWRCADAAIYRTKRAGGNRHALATSDKNKLIETTTWTSTLKCDPCCTKKAFTFTTNFSSIFGRRLERST
jgi:predicted signal transduction protein with EAL and GGDEF domain